MLARAKNGWLAQDDGTLAQAALRVLQGQLPHRDFVENYTGGLNYLNALGYKAFGVNLAALRVVMFVFFLLWVPTVFYAASRFVRPWAAAAVTLLAVAWSVPNYPTPMPSWYNLFFATMGVAALLRYLETDRWPWLFFAGIAGGLSCAAKIVGLYYVAAVLLWFVDREREMNGDPPQALATGSGGGPDSGPGQPARSSSLYRVFVFASLAAFLGVLVSMLRNRLSSGDVTHFLIPACAIVLGLVILELRSGMKSGKHRFRRLFGMIIPFVAGCAAPSAVLLAPYLRSSSLPAFFAGVFTAGINRVTGLGVLAPAPPLTLAYILPLLVLIVAANYWKLVSRNLVAVIIGVGLAGLLFIGHSRPFILRGIWLSASQATPIVVLTGVAILVVRPKFADALSKVRRQQLMLLLSLAALSSLVQFPFAAPIYFTYCSPLVILAIVALISVHKVPASRAILALVLAFYGLFAVLEVAPSRIFERWYFLPGFPVQTFRLPRGGGISGEFVRDAEVAALVAREHATDGLLIATPECPDLYFLSGLRNPTDNDAGLSAAALLRAIEKHNTKVVAINIGSTFSSGEITPGVIQELYRRYPQSVRVGKYWIGWRQ
jgi:hypothetical protein